MRLGRLSRFAADQGGASAVEFAIVLTPLLLIVFGGIEYGRLMWTRTALQEVAMATARCMGVKQPSCASGGSYSASAATSFAQAEATSWAVTIPTANITLSNSATCSGVSGLSQATLSYTFQTALPLLLGSLSGGKTLQASACFPNQS